MKQSLPAAGLLLVMIAWISCQKKDTISCLVPKEQKNQSRQLETLSQKNGSGPYVLNEVIRLSAANEVPALNFETQGVAHLRLTSDRVLYSKVIIQKLAEGDALRFAHVHSGITGVSGPIVVFLSHTADDFGKNMVTELTEEQYQFLLNDAAYVNAHSNFSPPGIARGQLRD